MKKGWIKGKKHTEESKLKNRLAHLGKKYPNRKKKGILTEQHKLNIKKSAIRGKNSNFWTGGEYIFNCMFCGKESHTRMARKNEAKYCSQKCSSDDRNKGLTPLHTKIRMSHEYHLWRTSVFIRDNRTCIWCGSKKDIQADHIKPFSLYPELRFAIDNGRTLCHECHKTTDTYGWKIKNNKVETLITK